MKEKNSFIAATFNLRRDCYCDGKRRWKHRKNAVIEIIRSIGADVLGVQELTPKMKRDIESRLPEYRFVGRPRCGGLLSEHNDILVKRDKFTVEEEETFWLSDKPGKVGSRLAGAFYPRICTNVRLRGVNGGCINILNTHYDHRSQGAREFASRLIKDKLDRVGKRIPTVVMGDLNSSPDSNPLAVLLNRGKTVLRDAVKEGIAKLEDKLDNGYFTFHLFKGKTAEKGSVLDYILISPDIGVLRASAVETSVDGVLPSDHFPVVAELTF